ncbi:MAG: cation:proton antiporter [Candidatus Micrarchaeota archaeon]|nr:cation:proton antiporter [Candidatus Micrarchaeota archaeon]
MASEFLALAVTAFSLGLASIIALKFRIPPLIVFLLMGMIAGTYGFLQSNTIITFIGNLGSVLLLFAIGTEFSIYKLFKSGFFKEAKTALVEVGVTFFLLYLFFSLWLSISVALILALAFSITSTGISLKLLQELNMSKKFDIPLIIKISVIEDLLAVLMFTFISSYSLSQGQPFNQVVESFILSIILFVMAYYAFYVFLNKFLFRYEIKEEDLLMLALGVLLLLVSIAGALNLSTSFGAYISGSIVSIWKDRWKSIDADLKKFSYIFISIFFLSIGLQVSLLNVDFLMLLIILPVVLVVKFAGVFAGTQVSYWSSRLSFFNSIGMLSRGELTLVLVSAAVTSGLLPQGYLGLAALVVFLTVVATFIMLTRSVDMYTAIRIRFPKVRIGHQARRWH